MSFFFLFALLFQVPKTLTTYDYRQKIAVIDTGIEITEKTKPYLCLDNYYDLTNTGIADKNGHGTNIAGIIAKHIDPKKSCLLIIKYYTEDSKSVELAIKGFEIAKEQKVAIINFSSGGFGKYENEQKAIQKALENRINIVVAAGNYNKNLRKGCDYYPPCYNFNSKYFHVVGNGNSEQTRDQSSNYGKMVTDWRDGVNIEGFGIYMTGTSQSTAVYSGELGRK